MTLLDVPYQPQADAFLCGPAALCMVLSAFGRTATQVEVWARVGAVDGARQWGAKPHRLAAEALRRGLAASVLWARDPVDAEELLSRCHRPDLRTVLFLNEAGAGHFAVLRGVDRDAVVVHDPAGRPDRRLSRDALPTVWGPRRLVLFSVASGASQACPHCRLRVPAVPNGVIRSISVDVTCPYCDRGTA